MAAAKSAISKNDINDLEPVKPADNRVIEIGQFAVAANNAMLTFVGVIGGFKWSVIGGNNYALIIQTQDNNGATYLQKAHVFEILGPNVTLKLVWYKN